jgi:hypothetical protein
MEVKKMNYLLRIKDAKTWKEARIKALRSGVSLREMIEKFLSMWVKGKING